MENIKKEKIMTVKQIFEKYLRAVNEPLEEVNKKVVARTKDQKIRLEQMNQPLDFSQFPNVGSSTLKKNGIMRVKDLVSMEMREVLLLRNIGKKSFTSMNKYVTEVLNLQWGMDTDEYILTGNKVEKEREG